VRDHLAYFEVPSPIAKRGNRGVSSEAFGQLQCPVLKCMGYEAGVIGGGQGLDSEGTGGEHGRGDNDILLMNSGSCPFAVDQAFCLSRGNSLRCRICLMNSS
jgi:hypothetical protein